MNLKKHKEFLLILSCYLIFIAFIFILFVALIVYTVDAIRTDEIHDPYADILNYTEEPTLIPILQPQPLRRPIVLTVTKQGRIASHHKLVQRRSNVIRPGVVFSKGRRNVQFVLGVPTIMRPNSTTYLLRTLRSLIDNMSDEDRNECLIVVCIGEVLRKNFITIVRSLEQKFSESLERGLIDVIAPAHNYYPDWKRLRINLNDTRERVVWRSKQNLDCMLLMAYARSRGDYYLHLEDDVLAKSGYIDYIRKFIVLHNSFRWLTDERKWLVMSFCELGFIGKLLATSELPRFLAFIQIFYNDQPIDWLLSAYVKMVLCRWSIFHSTECLRTLKKYSLDSEQSQFQHIGIQSSLEHKLQSMKAGTFGSKYYSYVKKDLQQPLMLLNSHRSVFELAMSFSEKTARNGIVFWGYLPRGAYGFIHDLFKSKSKQKLYRFQPSLNSRKLLPEVTMLEVLSSMDNTTLFQKGEQEKSMGYIVACMFNGTGVQIFMKEIYTFVEHFQQIQDGATLSNRINMCWVLLILICLLLR